MDYQRAKEIMKGICNDSLKYGIDQFEADLKAALGGTDNFDLVYRALLWKASKLGDSEYLNVPAPDSASELEWENFVETIYSSHLWTFAHLLKLIISEMFWDFMAQEAQRAKLSQIIPFDISAGLH